jgi:hypothetical protein
MKVSTKSWHYKFLNYMYDWHNLDEKTATRRLQQELQTMTKCDYILRVTKNVFWTGFWTTITIGFIIMLIVEGVMVPLLAVAFVIGVCIAIRDTYKKYNAKCATITMTDVEDTTDGTV